MARKMAYIALILLLAFFIGACSSKSGTKIDQNQPGPLGFTGL